jgi:hypothetical protein
MFFAEELNVMEVLASSDEVLPVLARHVTRTEAAAGGERVAVQETVQILKRGQQQDAQVLMSQQKSTNAAPTTHSLFNAFKQLEEEEEDDDEVAVPATEFKEDKVDDEALAEVAVHATKIQDVSENDIIIDGGDKMNHLNAVQGTPVEQENGDDKKL